MSGNLTILTDVFSEGIGGQFVTLTLIDPTSNGSINTAAISAATATLRSLDTGEAVFANTSVLPGSGSRGSYPSAGVLRITFTAADMTAVGHRELQRRELVVVITHSGDKVLKHVIEFPLSNVGEV